MKSSIDPGALLLGVVAAGLALVLAPGPFGWLSTLGGATLLLVLFAYDQQGERSAFQSIAFSAVCGMALTLGIGVVLQRLTDRSGLDTLLPLTWAIATIVFAVVDRIRMSSRVAGGAQPQVPRTSPGIHIVPSLLSEPAPSYVPPQSSYVPPQSAPSHQQPAYVPPQPTHVPPQPTAGNSSAPAYNPPPAPAYAPPPPMQTVSSVVPEVTVPGFTAFQSQPASQPTPPPSYTAPAPPPPPAPAYTPNETTIYVAIVGEGISMLRPVKAEHLARDIYRISDTTPEGERWRYEPGQTVRCKKQKLSSGKALVAFEEIILQRVN